MHQAKRTKTMDISLTTYLILMTLLLQDINAGPVKYPNNGPPGDLNGQPPDLSGGPSDIHGGLPDLSDGPPYLSGGPIGDKVTNNTNATSNGGFAYVLNQNNTNVRCRLKATDDTLGYMISTRKEVRMWRFHLHMVNYTTDPLTEEKSIYFKPWMWEHIMTQYGQTLLMLTFHYNVLSMSMLNIGVVEKEVEIMDYPEGCFKVLSADNKILLLRLAILSNFGQFTPFVDQSEMSDELVCNRVITNTSGMAKFVDRCCHQTPDGRVDCSEKDAGIWIFILYVAIGMVKLVCFMYGPLMIPKTMYVASYMAAEYVVKLKDKVNIRLFISDSTETSIRFRKRLTPADIAHWHRFKAAIEDFPRDEIIPLKMSELRVEAKGLRIIAENEPPTGLLRSIYDNLVRCKIKNIEPCTECCLKSIWGSMEAQVKHRVTWHDCLKVMVKILTLFLLPIPFYIRLLLYYMYEHKELSMRREALDTLGLQESYSLYRRSVLQYLTPTHPVFLFIYVLYFLSGFVMGSTETWAENRLKHVVRKSFQDMSNISYAGVLHMIVRILLWPYRRFGLLGILFAPFYTAFALPFTSVAGVCFCVPTVYLTFRFIVHTRSFISDEDDVDDDEVEIRKRNIKRKMKKSARKVGKHLNIDNISPNRPELRLVVDTHHGDIKNKTSRAIIGFFIGIFCVCTLYSGILILVECTAMFVEIMAFTMMGVIVNAGSTLKYVSMVLLVFLYMHDCYNKAYENYVTFNKAVVEDMMGRVDDLQKIACLPSNVQENAAFKIRPKDEDFHIPTAMVFDKKVPRWRIGHLLVFLDCLDTPRIPLKLFKQLCEIRVHGCPGPVHLSLIEATLKFIRIVLFLCFVLIVVMAFGDVYKISSTNQTLATMAGGFVPLLLRHVFSSDAKKLALKTLSFRGQVDEIINEYKQHWPIHDLVIDDEEDEEEMKEEEDQKDASDNDDEKKDNTTEKREKSKEKNFVEAVVIPKEQNDKKLTIPVPSTPVPQRRMAVIDMMDNFVDIFLDLSEEIAPSWQMSTSHETIQSVSMMELDRF